MQIIVRQDPADLADEAARFIARLLRPEDEERISLGLAGGSTPRATYERLRYADVPWPRIDAWLSDERWVPIDHPDSNGGMARAALFDAIPARFHPVPWGPDRPPAAAAEEYAATLLGLFADRPNVVLLGMGTDGHTASLFPGTAALDETEATYVANPVPGRGWRLTATLPLLHAARHLVFLVAGAAKAEVLARVIAGDDLPARRVAAGAAQITWLVDRAAAAHLDRDLIT
jgi:6-phosphogluconolactonase